MKDYKRLTKRITASNTGRTVLVIPTFRHEIIEQTNRLGELEDKIESGEIIEQKTCKNISEKNPVDEFICSECGFHYEDFSETKYDEDGEYSYKVEFVTKYCPNCGAKVEDEE